MGIGFTCSCKKCNYKHNIYIGSGFLNCASLDYTPTEKVLFICPECGWWKETKLELEDDKIRKCFKCKNEMKTYKQNLGFENIDSMPKMLCKKCGGEFEKIDRFFQWD